jgi:hypothetical protein
MEPVLNRTYAYKLWLVWLVTAVAALTAKPWGDFGWGEWIAVAIPLILILQSIQYLQALIAGLALSTLAWSADGGSWAELALLWVVLTAGIAVGVTATRLERKNIQLQHGCICPTTGEDPFYDALNRELCRARRDESSFAVLSVDREGEQHNSSLASVCELLDDELRAYADISQVGDRVLALVPEVSNAEYQPLLKRLKDGAASADCGAIRIGLARFPRDAVCAQELVDTADRKRLVRQVPPMPSANQDQTPIQGQVST